MNNETVKRHLTDLKVEWRFNMERAAWWGGIFERMIGSMKRCLRKMIGRATFTYEELLTAVTEVEVVVNSRPISYVFSDDLAEALTPSHLIMGRRILGLPDHLYYDQPTDPNFELTPTLINKRMKHFSKLLDHFWKRWRKEYLVNLREQHKTPKRTSELAQIKVGDIVLVHDDSKKRGFWSLGKVEELIAGIDNKVRGAVVTVYTGGRHTKLLRRSIAHLYPLEIHHQQAIGAPIESTSSSTTESVESNDSQPSNVSRPTRKAAAEARDRILAHNLV